MKRTKAPRQVVGYLRVSTTEQAQAGFSLDAQRARLEIFASSARYQPIDEWLVDDGCSGSSLDRPAVKELLRRIDRREIAAVYITKLDRLSRNLRDVLTVVDLCQRTETALLSATETLDTSSAVGRMVVHLLGTFAEFERGRISERTSDVLGYKRRAGKVYCKHAPFGYRRDGDVLVEVPDELDALAVMRSMRSDGATYQAIIEALDARGVKPHRGVRWYPSSVRSVLTSKMNGEAV